MNWPTAKLGDIFDIARGGSPRPIDDFISEAQDAMPWISIRDASDSSKFITKTRLKIRREGISRSRVVNAGDFLLTNSMSFGRPYICGLTGCIHDGWLVLAPRDPRRVDQDFFYQLLGSDLVYRQFAKLAAGAVVKNLNIDLVAGVSVPFPPALEQRRIAAILDRADAVRRKRKEAVARTEELLRSAFLEIFGDPVTNPKGWPTSTFGAELEDMEYGPRFYNEKYSDAGVRIVRITDLNAAGELDFESMPRLSMSEADRARYTLKPGELIFARTGATVGKTALVEDGAPECVAGAYFIRLRLKKRVHPRYARMVLASERVQAFIARRSRQSAQQNFSGPGIRELALPVPPLALQRQLDAIAARCAKLASVQVGHSDRANDLFETLVQRAFRGELTRAGGKRPLGMLADGPRDVRP